MLWFKVKNTTTKDIRDNAVTINKLESGIGESLNISSNVSITSKVSNGDLESALTIRDNEISLKASQSALDATNTRVTTAESSITVNANAITLKASQTSLNATNVRMTTAEASIVVQAEQITLKVSASGVISAINLSPETITISATNIGLLGAVNIPNLTANKIVGGTLTLGGVNNGSGIMKLIDNTGAVMGTFNNAGINLFGAAGTYSAKHINGVVATESRIWSGAIACTYDSTSAPATNTSIQFQADANNNWFITTGQTIFVTDGSDLSISYGVTVGGNITFSSGAVISSNGSSIQINKINDYWAINGVGRYTIYTNSPLSTGGGWVSILFTNMGFIRDMQIIHSNADGLATKHRNLSTTGVEVCISGTATGYVDCIITGSRYA